MFALIGETLFRLRKEHGKTLDMIGKEAGLGRGQLSRIENAHQEATLKTLAKILTSQGVSRREFFRRYELVESEAQAVEREKGGAPTVKPQEIQDVLGRVESFLQSTLNPVGTVAQGAIEVGDLVVLFRVVPRAAAPLEPASPPPGAGRETAGKAPRSGRPARAGARKRKP